MNKSLQSLGLDNIKPMCPDHKPKGRYVTLPESLGGGVTFEVSCPNCSFYGLIHPEALKDL